MKCEKCNIELNESGFCPQCGQRYIVLTEGSDFRDGYIIKKKDKTKYKSKKHPYYYEEMNHHEFSRTLKQFVKRLKVEDRMIKTYKEVVETLDGKVIHSCEEPLFYHKSHGCAKIKEKENEI